MTVADQGSVLEDVRTIIESTIKISADKLDIDARFEELGVDSIIAMELMENLSRHFDIKFTPAQFLNVNTVGELAVYLQENFELETESASTVVSSRAGTAPPASAAQQQESGGGYTPIQGLLDSVNRKYGIDLTGRNLDSVDQIVDELVANNFDELAARFDLSGLSSHDQQAFPGRGTGGDVAIVGLSCRFPDAPSSGDFWKNLLDRRKSIGEIPKSRWDWERYYASSASAGKTVSRWGAFIEDIDCFDPHFFGMTPEEAKIIDPQERLLLQEVYRAIQDAGMDRGKLAGSKTGVFVGYEYAEYEQYLRRHMAQIPGLIASSSSPTYYLANRLSFLFDFRGPSEAINVNCASSAVAINRAYLSLVSGESDLAIAGAACLHLFADDYVTSSQYGLLSPDGTCAVFDDQANGFSRGEGVAALVLKRLDAAIADNDRIYAVIRACHQNNRGGGHTLSDVKHEAITDVMKGCYEKASFEPESIDYIELNGYAKKWPDSFEFEGIRHVFAGSPPEGKTCALGSLKGNIGHLEPVNGIASVIKVALSLHHKKFPASITKDTTSTFIDLEDRSHPLYFADSEIEFQHIRKDVETPVRAGVSSFADSGVNVHIVLEEFIPRTPANSAPVPAGEQLFIVSAQDRHRLADYIGAYIDFLSVVPESISFADLVYTAQTGREAMGARVAVVAASFDELRKKLSLLRENGIDVAPRLEGQGVFYGGIDSPDRYPLDSLITGDMVRVQLETSLRTRQWQQIARLWVHGVEVPWALCWTGQAVQRTSLPGYPFARERCWVDVTAPADVTPVSVKNDQDSLPVIPEASPVSLPGSARWHFSMSDGGEAESAPSLVPAAKLELFLRQEIALQRGCAVEEIDAHSNFVELGMNSISIAELMTRISQLLTVSLAPSLVFKYPRLADLASYLAQRHEEKAASLMVVEQSDTEPPTARGSGDGPHQAAPPSAGSATETGFPDILVPMQTRGERDPIFLVPGSDGSLLSLKLLCEALGDKLPLYGLESVGLDGKTPLPHSVEETAKLNIQALKTIQPIGPYRLLGYSNGGVVAFEMARALLLQNEEVASLMLLDSLCPPQRRNGELDLVVDVFSHLIDSMGGQLDLSIAQLEQVAPEDRAEYLYQFLTSHGMELDKQYFTTTYKVATNSERLCRAYTLQKLPRETDVVLFRAVDGYRDVPRDYGWNRYLLKPVRTRDIKANHFSLIEEGAVGELAKKINTLMRKSSGGRKAALQRKSQPGHNKRQIPVDSSKSEKEARTLEGV